MCDLGNGKFDGAHLVANFEGLNPANTFWDKYYHLYANVDTEPPRFLEFERWWGGFYLLNEEEICWIVNELFVGNRLARGEIEAAPGTYLNLKDIRSPLVVFSSAGDNITPPQQALNWIADVYSSTEEIKANGQVIVGLFHETVGHLGVFVSGKVARKEYSQIVEVLRSIEQLPPGLYLCGSRTRSRPTGSPRTRYPGGKTAGGPVPAQQAGAAGRAALRGGIGGLGPRRAGLPDVRAALAQAIAK